MEKGRETKAQNRPRPGIDPDAFHDHLDKCAQCRNHPFNLCPKGAALLTGKLKKG